MLENITQQDGFVLLFDIHFRSWFGDQVGKRYCGSQFMGHATADDMMEHFHQTITQLNMRQLWQLSMDGPNVNLKFHDMLQQPKKVDYNMTLLNIGRCGLHIIHRAFKYARIHQAVLQMFMYIQRRLCESGNSPIQVTFPLDVFRSIFGGKCSPAESYSSSGLLQLPCG